MARRKPKTSRRKPNIIIEGRPMFLPMSGFNAGDRAQIIQVCGEVMRGVRSKGELRSTLKHNEDQLPYTIKYGEKGRAKELRKSIKAIRIVLKSCKR